MRSRLFRHVLALIAVSGLALGSPALASRGVHSGGGKLHLSKPSKVLLVLPLAGGNVLVVESGTLDFLTGTIVGTGPITVAAVVNPATGETLIANWSAPATVNGQQGTLTFLFEGKDNGTFRGSFTVNGSAGLKGFHGHGKFRGRDTPGNGTYTLRYRS
jgi:hypothetical protein